MNHTARMSLGALVVLASAASIAPSASASTPSPHVYQHGAYAGSHFSSRASCDASRSNVISTLRSHAATSIDAGDCHPIDAKTASGLAQTGFVYDVTYRRTNPLYRSDVAFDAAKGLHSFKVLGSYTSKTDATAAEAKNATKLNTTSSKVTWRSSVVYNTISKRWVYEIDYTARKPAYREHIEISQAPNVTSPSLGISVIAPTDPNAGNGGMTPTNPTQPATPPVTPTNEPIGVAGIDISSHTRVSDWAGWKNAGVKFLWTKVSEGTYYTNPKYVEQSRGAANAGIIWGDYHFATPNTSTGTQQADYAIAHGGGWKPNSNRLPTALDMEWNPYGDMCFSKSPSELATFVSDFENEMKNATGAYSPIYTAKIWWNTCVGSSYHGPKVPLWLANYHATPGAMPTGWTRQMVWQNAAIDSRGYDTDVFNGTLSDLKRYANTGVWSN